ncbi:MAG: N-acetylmuramoyl-L-alanine amidase [Rikenellaceae bacterium]|nr:N-acetylmuramoyl-L-alanine amidase [Rikenellaceae bacterium]
MKKLALCLMLVVSLLWSANAEAATYIASPKKRVVVLDPGHGGPHRVGASRKGYYEKDINLSVSLMVKKMLAEKASHITVYMTRSTDVELAEDRNADNRKRPKFANDKKADLFISIHANDVDTPTDANKGFEAIVLNLDEKTQKHTKKMSPSLNAHKDYVLFEDFKKDAAQYLDAISRLMSNDPMNRMFGKSVGEQITKRGYRFNGVLDATQVYTVLYPLECPGIILEMGYMCNAGDLAYLTSEKGQKDMADAISDAIVDYFENIERMEEYAQNDTGSEDSFSNDNYLKYYVYDSSGEGYTIQLMSSSTELDIYSASFKEFKGIAMLVMGTGTFKYKYCYGCYPTAAAAQSELAWARKSFKDAIVTRYKAGKIVSTK